MLSDLTFKRLRPVRKPPLMNFPVIATENCPRGRLFLFNLPERVVCYGNETATEALLREIGGNAVMLDLSPKEK